jgi:diguanylate cyclase (GGDEF)-like protein
MQEALTVDELQRLESLRSYAILDSQAEQAYDDIVSLASHICGVPIALISLVDEDRQWFKARVGLDVAQTPRSQAFCAHAILQPDQLMEVPDATQDPRFADNPLVTGDPGIRFYAGVPFVASSGMALGTVCVIDRVPRTLTPAMAVALKALSRQVTALLSLRRTVAELRLLTQAQAQQQKQLDSYRKQLEEVNRDLSEQTQRDPLTGLKNRRAFDHILREELSRAQRVQSSLGLLMVDVDHFKPFNDAFGHVAGDAALQQIANVLQAQVRSYDHVARYGGEEFAVVLPDSQQEEVLAVANRVRAAVEAMPSAHRSFTVSVGAAMAILIDTPTRLVERADKALYQAKHQGRNGVVALDGDATGP